MGNNPPQSESNFEQFEHPRLGNVKLYDLSNSQNQQYFNMEYLLTINNQRQLHKWLQNKKLIENAETSEVLLLPLKHTYQSQSMCGSAGIIKLTYQNYLFLLDNEIKNRKQIQRPFLQTEMWYLIYNMIRAGKQYEKINKKIGDVQPSNVVINQDGQIKIISIDSWPSQSTNYQKIIESFENKTYLAPEECNEKLIKKGEYPSNVNQSLAQVFSIGLTLLQAATLDDCSTIYITNPSFEFNVDQLKKILNNLKNRYSIYLVRMISQMVQLVANQRPTCGQLYSILIPYDEEILNLQEFQFDKNQSLLSYNNYIKNQKTIKANNWNINNFFQIKSEIKPFVQASQANQSYNYQIPQQQYSNPSYSHPNIATSINKSNMKVKSTNYQFQNQAR